MPDPKAIRRANFLRLTLEASKTLGLTELLAKDARRFPLYDRFIQFWAGAETFDESNPPWLSKGMGFFGYALVDGVPNFLTMAPSKWWPRRVWLTAEPQQGRAGGKGQRNFTHRFNVLTVSPIRRERVSETLKTIGVTHLRGNIEGGPVVGIRGAHYVGRESTKAHHWLLASIDEAGHYYWRTTPQTPQPLLYARFQQGLESWVVGIVRSANVEGLPQRWSPWVAGDSGRARRALSSEFVTLIGGAAKN